MSRKFEVVSYYEDKEINLPKRATINSAGYDLEAASPETINPGQVTYIPTGLKVSMNPGEVLQIYPRSSVATKYMVTLPNNVGIVDQDYYDNIDNEGHILVPLVNLGKDPFVVNKGDRIAQAIFTRYLTVDNEEEINSVRTGGFGSTNKSDC